MVKAKDASTTQAAPLAALSHRVIQKYFSRSSAQFCSGLCIYTNHKTGTVSAGFPLVLNERFKIVHL